MAKTLTIDVWSDVVCPWCAIGKCRLDAALAKFSHRDSVRIAWRAFELDPSAPRVQEGDNAARLGRKYGRTRAQAEAMIRNVEQTAAQDGLEFDLLDARSGNTFDAHRLLKLAAERGVQGAVKERFFRGYMAEKAAIGEPETLVRLASEAGLDAEEVRAVLASDRYAKEVRDEEASARSLGINGVPFFVLAGQLAVSGAQPADVMLRALEQAWAALPASDAPDTVDGATCGPEGCA
ncbi:MAG TPA: DsbA family oxidoreductase [Polyangiaceae bacterium]|jgi:predicted DsbA family dithiol-disulfide isomerase